MRPAASRSLVFAAVFVPLALSITKDDPGTPIANAAQVSVVAGNKVATQAFANASTPFRLPWAPGTSLYLTQDADDDCCSDHVGANKYAFDLATWEGTAFDVVAPAAGTLVHVKMSSNSGCATSACVNDANYLVIDHGDGTQTTMLHLAKGSLDPAVACGGFVRRGQRLARTGSTGWSTGNHLHVERDQVRKNLKKVCECGPDGLGCAPSHAEWNLFWPSVQQPNLPMKFQEWTAADAPGNRRGMIGPSVNVDDREDVFTIGIDGRLVESNGTWQATSKGGARAAGFRHAKADGNAQAVLSLKGAGVRPGVYEIWGHVPLADGVALGETSVTLRSSKGTTDGLLDSHTTGGAYHPIKGLERVTIMGDEDLVFASAQPSPGKHVVADGIVLRRAYDVSMPVAKAP